MKRRLNVRIVAAATTMVTMVVASVVAIGALATAGPARAQEPTPTRAATSQQHPRRDAFVNNLAGKLQIAPEHLRDALRSTGQQTIDDLAAAGEITSAQAEHLRERLASANGLGLRSRGYRRAALVHRVRSQIVESSATAIGIDPQELRAALQSGQSIAAIASEHNVSPDAVKVRIMADAKTNLDHVVQDGRIDQSREDALLQKLEDSLDRALNKVRPPRPGATVTPEAN